MPSYILLEEGPQCDENIEWQCLDKSGCVDRRRRCDGYEDCSDGSDENEDLCYNCKQTSNITFAISVDILRGVT